jgi:hypothetical protein
VRTPTRILVGILLVCVLGAAAFKLVQIGLFGATIFVLIPVMVGSVAVWVFPQRNGGRAAGVGALAVLAALALFLLLAIEGLICIAMAAPLALPLGAFGGWLAYASQASRTAARGSAAMLLLLSPASVTWDAQATPPVYEVHSAITIAAPPERVWPHVVSFSEMPAPQEWYFRTGLAFPTRARMSGTGPGAVRYCDFSTGPVVEPIEVWDENRLLQFKVTENPAPMRELSPYGDIAPKHLHGYFISKRGQFRLTRLANNQTLLEGTSWYQHGLWPAQYWRCWSDAIVHRIHARVFNHIRVLSEGPQ